MKRLFPAIIIALSTAIAASAQEFTDTPEFYTGSTRLSLGMFDSFGVGFISPSGIQADGCTADYIANTAFGRNREIFFNLLFLGFHPYYSGTIQTGIDLRWNAFRLDKTHYWIPDGNGAVSVADAAGTYSAVKKSTLRVMSFDIPLDYTQRFGHVEMTLGAAAELNLPGTTKFKGVDMQGNLDKQTHRGDPMRATDIGTNLFTYSFHASLSFYGVGLYAKYRPVPQFSPACGPLLTTWSFGLLLH